MKTVKIFLASSAELNADKDVFDLFMSEKNKVYRKRQIDFELRTWKDFVSSIHLKGSQNEYNRYIKTCDIVVFLFHTRVGQYTLEEFNVAFQELRRTKGRRPQIYMYFKDSSEVIPAIDAFKQRIDEYKHFYDTYSSNEELLHKFERQLQELENEGYIKPQRVDVKTVTKYALLFLLPVLTVFLAFIAVNHFYPLNTTVRLTEVQAIPALPFEAGELSLIYADKTETQTITDEVIFKQIASKYKNTPARLLFSANGYEPIDTTVQLKKMIDLPIRRDNSLGLIFGTVKDENNLPLPGVILSVQDLQVTSDAGGRFRIEISFDKQKEEQRLTAFKAGYQLWDFTAAPSPTTEWKIILKKNQ